MKASFEHHLKLHLIICRCEGEKQINMLAGNILCIICSLWNGKLREATLETHYGRNALFSSVQWVGKTPQNSKVKYLTKRYTSQSTGGCSQQDGSQDTWLVTAAGCLPEPRSISRATGKIYLAWGGAMGAGGRVLGVNIWSGVFHLTICSRCGMRQGLHRRCEANKKRAAETKPDGPRRTFKIAGGEVGGQPPTCWTQATTTTTTTAAKKVWLFLHLARGVEDWSRFTDGSTRLATTLSAAEKTLTNRAEDRGSPQGWTHASARVGNCVRLNLPSSPA